ncbi:hypothetical protein F5Y03DRAFT_228239 [Xylaria venustula]|nr:hypothetical protein F5Y03DRAFT_228239 [Xylaria venustula]
MVVTFIPYDTKKLNMIVASALQRSSWENAAPSISRLDINRVLPKGSLVFEVVRNGDLRALQVMLRNSEASLRDHDEFGANLLMYSIEQPELCKFLLSTNAFDLDHVSGDAGVRNDRDHFSFLSSSSILNFPLPRIEMDICSRLLLEAGADPTLRTQGYSCFELVAMYGSPEYIKGFWDSARKYYFDSFLNDTRSDASHALLAACLNPHFRFRQKVSLFRNLGADISLRDHLGRSCLHLYLANLGPIVPILDLLGDIKSLLENGADPCARDQEGVSVSELVYESKGVFSEGGGSFLGDLWDRSLHDRGYDIAKFRRPRHQRKADYTVDYTRQDFILLWQDHEGECPYWDDIPWPQLLKLDDSDEEVDKEPFGSS